MYGDLGSRARLTPGSHLWWHPAETNNPILYGWFWEAKKPVRSAEDLVNIYYQSVGRNSNWILNLSPDTRGLIPDNQLAPLRLMAQVVKETFAKDLAAGGVLASDNANPQHKPAFARDGNLDTWWEAAAGQTTATLTLKLPQPVTFDVVSLQEAVNHRGQRVESFSVDVWDGVKWVQKDEQTTIGYKRILRWSIPVTTDQVRVRITGSRLEPTVAELALFKQAELVPAPKIADRDPAGSVTITSVKDLSVVYTLDGSTPTANSPRYSAPIALPRGGTVHAAMLDELGRLGMMSSRYFAGFAAAGWKVIASDGEQTDDPASNVIDGHPGTFWQSSAENPVQAARQITLVMPQAERIVGFAYLPRQDGKQSGIVEDYRFETSSDGESWMTAASGRFGNIQNNPDLQEVRFAPVDARYLRLTALHTLDNNASMSAAEISVLPAEETNKETDSK
jgi:alpha-L-fucosidase